MGKRCLYVKDHIVKNTILLRIAEARVITPLKCMKCPYLKQMSWKEHFVARDLT